MKKLSKKSQEILDAFSENAKDWGWSQDQGTGNSVNISESNYNTSKDVLKNRLLYLEKKNKKNAQIKASLKEFIENGYQIPSNVTMNKAKNLL